jgi:hypothetical protein
MMFNEGFDIGGVEHLGHATTLLFSHIYIWVEYDTYTYGFIVTNGMK